MIGLGELDRTVVFLQERETSRNAFNEPVMGAPTKLRAKVRRRDVSDQERVSAGKEASVVMARFLLLSRPATRKITAADVFDCDGRRWSIEGIKQVSEGRNLFLEISAVSTDAHQL
ncbi:head-tail adaptor protein [Pacificoceanicola onchidii]|uniref:phage head completion protein n=1 Tax=Pacificoceanicola onchidii TaxID=2562685 RepID=UPI0010A5A06C|nr:head-tail adaptor protein [Pacificoceanicola onchidii]